MKRIGIRLGWFVLAFMLALTACGRPSHTSALRAGLRASSYGISPFPEPSWWLDAAASMASGFEDAQPAVVWIVGKVNDEYCWLNFPAPEGKSSSDYEHILFSPLDDNEAYLNRFDEQGVRVWLQVEPSGADVETLIELVMSRYRHHPSVVGFGVDVEWFQHRQYPQGKAVTDAEAQAWVEQVRSLAPDNQLFLKHWLTAKMPPHYRDGIMFLDDSQQFRSLDEMKTEFVEWGRFFAPAPVGFQYGYPADYDWWGEFQDPPHRIGQALLAEIPNVSDLYWVDFSAYQIWPPQQ